MVDRPRLLWDSMYSMQGLIHSMKITDLFIRRPVLALVVNLLIIIAGLEAIRAINVRQYPRSENAAVTVTTVYVGADSDLVRGFVTTPLERSIAAADGNPIPVDREAGNKSYPSSIADTG